MSFIYIEISEGTSNLGDDRGTDFKVSLLNQWVKYCEEHRNIWEDKWWAFFYFSKEGQVVLIYPTGLYKLA